MNITWPGIIAIAILILSCLHGYRRGLIREVVSLICVVLSIVLVWFINPYVNNYIRENTSIYETIQQNCSKFAEEKGIKAQTVTEESQENAISDLEFPDLLSGGLTENNNSSVYQYLSVNTFSDYVVGYLAQIVVNGISFLISFILATLFIRCITWATNLIAGLPVIRGVNKITGGLLGGVKFVIMIWILFLVFTVLCNTKLGDTALKLIMQDPLLNYLYDKDILIKIFMNILDGK